MMGVGRSNFEVQKCKNFGHIRNKTRKKIGEKIEKPGPFYISSLLSSYDGSLSTQIKNELFYENDNEEVSEY